MKIDVISDIHLDFWVKLEHNPIKFEKNIRNFVLNILPETPSSILIIAGDMGHNNKQNFIFITILKEYYEHILIVPGNHDYYLESSNQKKKYKNNSMNRWNEMKTMYQELDRVHVLEGDTIEIEGILFGGTGMWYDFSYGIQHLNKSYTALENILRSDMNDYKLTGGLPRFPYDMFQQEKDRLEQIVHADVLITHVGPDWSRMPEKYRLDPCSSFYFFDGKPYFHLLENKTWIFGHTHVKYDYMAHGCWFVNASLGYPKENNGQKQIITIPIEKVTA